MQSQDAGKFAGSLGRCSDPRQITSVAEELRFELLDEAGMEGARALAADVLGGSIATIRSYNTVRSVVGSGIFGFREHDRWTGLSASFPLAEAGLAALVEDRFDAINLDPNHLARPGETPAAYYGWGFLGVTKRAAANVVLLSRAIHRRLFWATPTYTRAVTEAGMRSCLSMGFRPAPGGPPSLLWIPPYAFAPGRAP